VDFNLYAKLEFFNLMGSVKIRPAYYIMKKAIEEGFIDENTTIIESSSGNFAIALAMICRLLKIEFIPVIDPNINSSTEQLLRIMCSRVEKVDDIDQSGGYLINRIRKVKQLLHTIPNAYWPNQYENINNFWAHYHGLGEELAQHFDRLDYAFIGVSSGGTVSGVSQRLKQKFPAIQIVAVDCVGSAIFGRPTSKRFISGIGSSIVPPILSNAVIDQVIHVDELETVEYCKRLFEEHGFLCGGSSGTSYAAIKKFFADKAISSDANVVFICPDAGHPYLDTVYNPDWVQNLMKWKRVDDSAVIS
jgi:cysteine synthase A